MAQLTVRTPAGERVIEMKGEMFSIGRASENDLELDDPLVSRRHASIIWKGNRRILYDLGSHWGTRVNGQRIGTWVLESGDRIKIGKTLLIFEDEEGPPAECETLIQRVEEIATVYGFDTRGSVSQEAPLLDMPPPASTETQREARNFFILYQIGKEIISARSLEEVLEGALDLIFGVIPAERGVILVLHRQSGRLSPHVAKHRTRGILSAEEMPFSTTIAERVLREQVSMATPDALGDERFQSGASIAQHGIRSVLCVPLWEKGEVFGVVYVDNLFQPRVFEKEDLELLTAIANQIAIRMKQEELHAKWQREALLRANLSRYHSPDVVEILAKQPDRRFEVEEKIVTVLFIDVQGSTALAERLGPAAIAGLLNDFFKVVTEAIFASGGHVNKYIGDSVLGIFGAPFEMPDHPVQAVSAGLRMLKAIRTLGERTPFDVRIGINTGPVIAGDVGPENLVEYSVLGDTVNVAARMTKLPEINRVVIGPETAREVAGRFPLRSLGRISLRGKQEEVELFEVIPK